MPKGKGKGKKGKKRGMKLEDLLDLAQEKVQEKLDNREKFTDVSYLNYQEAPEAAEKREEVALERAAMVEEEEQQTAYQKLLQTLGADPTKKRKRDEDSESTSKKKRKKRRKMKQQQQQDEEDGDGEEPSSVMDNEESETGDVVMKAWNEKREKLLKKEQADRDAKDREMEGDDEGNADDYEENSEDQLAIDEVEDFYANDNFLMRFEKNMTKAEIEAGTSKKEFKELSGLKSSENFGKILSNELAALPRLKHSLEEYKIKPRLIAQWKNFFNKWYENAGEEIDEIDGVPSYSEVKMTPMQQRLFSLMNEYVDICYSGRTVQNAKQIRGAYVLHAVNHLFKTRDRILKNNGRLINNKELEFRDQGFTRPKILILLPIRSAALDVVEDILSLMPKNQRDRVQNKKKFYEEFLDATYTPVRPKLGEWLQIFRGNTDDSFRIGLAVTKKSINLYSEFYGSDIIVASPLGLRLAIEQHEDDHDYLSSIELTIVDHADMLLMQNWDHLKFIFDRLNKTPKKPDHTDFARVKQWYLDEHAQYYRQTMIFSGALNIDINSLFNRCCHNTLGKLKIKPNYSIGAVSQVIPKIRQIFHRIECTSAKQLDDARFNYFVTEVYPHIKTTLQHGVLIYIPSYFDYVRVRNFFRQKQKTEEILFTQTCEYTSEANISRARSNFYHGKRDIMLFTERFHYYNRFFIRGIKHIIFYSLPVFPHFYPEMVNMVPDDGTVLSVFSHFDALQLEPVVGTKRCERLLSSEKATHLFC